MGDRGHGWRPRTPTQWLLVALAVAWLGTVLLIQLDAIDLTPLEIASSPDALTDGRLARLLSSSLVIDDDVPLLQFALLAAVAALVMVRHGAVVWWVAALAGHIGSALIAYAVIGIAIALSSGSADASADDLDYGISAVLAALLGVLVVDSVRGLRSGRRDPLDLVLIALAAVMLIIWFATLDWFGIEHQFAFLLGAGSLVLCERVARRSARAV
jgi:hypothetical protein